MVVSPPSTNASDRAAASPAPTSVYYTL
jgi:hypothetical protein